MEHREALDEAQPPSYDAEVTPDFESVPEYFEAQQSSHPSTPAIANHLQEFEYKLDKNGKTFATLTLIANKLFSDKVPTFVEGAPIKGMIHLNLDNEKPEHVSSLSIRVEGQLITGGSQFWGYTYTFLDVTQEIWTRSHDESGLTQGQCTWPISINLPEKVSMQTGTDKHPEMFRLPQTFNERNIHSTVRYELSMKITRSGLLRSNDILSTPFAFIPVTRPDPFPPLKRLAYDEGTPLLPPKVDPEGWFPLRTVLVEGKTPNNNTAKIECRLYLSRPLSYTRGSVVPLFMTLESDNQQALDLLSSPNAPNVRVRRRTKYHSEPKKKIESKAWRDEVDHSQRAVWWPTTESSDRIRMIAGELHLKPNMAPTLAMGDFRINYSVVFLKFKSPGFLHKEENPLLSEEPITIVTAYAPGPRPRMFTTPDYTPDEEAESEDLQSAVEFSKGFY
ncbi:hypothetical protein JR316_0011610 [Psilocybe cubensis]|uniref:Uncharacterized protein n=2 Tax=Psilocybe cubensis TaxID=181762 RepID=A0ACB8GKH7_PSICU|nr:hypothetical protein JR316_0011610 [Psilocybe cubensis]KAH9476041.1 hypothetical protein JR316_0011610 [Psilocybe cubensis]